MEQLWKEVKTYIDLRIKSFKLQATEQLSLAMGKLLSLVSFIVLGGFAILLLSLALTIVLSKWVGLAWAFVIVGGLYAILAIVCMLLRDRLFSNAMVKTFVKMFFPEEDQIEEDTDDED